MAASNPDCACGDPKSVHRLGRKGCKELDCGCDKFESVEDQAETERVLTAVAEVCTDHAERARAELAAMNATVDRDAVADFPGGIAHAAPVAAESDAPLTVADVQRAADLVDRAGYPNGAAVGDFSAFVEREASLGEPLPEVPAEMYAPDAEPLPDEPEVLGQYDAYACVDCAAGELYTDHTCGPLLPVTVTITVRQEA